MNDCYSCGNFECFKHPGKTAIKKRRQVTTFILDEKWSEYDDYIKQLATNDDYFIVPYHPNDNPTRSDRYTWTIKNQTNVRAVPFAAMRRALYTRLNSRTKNNVFSLGLKLDRGMAAAIVKHIPVECTHIVIAQNLLPFVWEQGAFGGRTYDVLMTRLPMEKLHERLDMAVAQHPESKTLNDFRAPQSLIELENISLTKSRHIITPHHEIANIFNNKSILLQWNYPAAKNGTAHKGNKILFPASALGRKGAYEVRRLAQELNLIIVVTGKATEDAKFWQGVTVESAGANPFENIGLVVYPAYVEHRPRVLLKAIAMGLPVIASTASGLGQADNLTIIPTGDYNALKGAVSEKMNARVYIS